MSNRKSLAAIDTGGGAPARPGGRLGTAAPDRESSSRRRTACGSHYLVVGQGDPVLLLHGFGQSSHMWRPLMRELAKNHTVIAADLRGAGQSDAPRRVTRNRRWRATCRRS